jgi:DNA-binding MarR family transcriptional regulator
MAVPVPYPLDTGSTLAAGADVCQSGRVSDGSDPDYAALLAFRTALRQFNRWSEMQARGVGLTHAQHQLLLAVKGHPDDRGPTIGEVASYLLLRHHSAVELINRAQAGGFVERHRDDADARVVRLQLTARGADRIHQLTQLHVEELQQLAPLLRHVIQANALRPVHVP